VTASLLVSDRVDALKAIDDLNRWTNTDAVNDASHAATLLVATVRPHLAIFILTTIDFALAVAGTFPDGTTFARLGDLDRVGAAV
jgi:hypothetical protein